MIYKPLIKNNKGILILPSIILLAITCRVFFLWIGRPEFVGWFNHTYYYYVQTKGLLEKGTLPFSDMPLLFYLYAFTSKLFIWFGADAHTAIINSTRFWMCIIPSLIPIPTFLIFKSISHQKHLDKWLWALVFSSAFLPLTLLYIPEFLQKNALGMLLLIVFILLSKKVLSNFTLKNTISLALVFLIIILTHYGSSGVAILYLLSVLIGFLLSSKKLKTSGLYAIKLIIVAIILAFGLIYLIDVQRYERIFFYLQNSFNTSFLGIVFSANTNVNDKLIALGSILIPVLIICLLYRLYNKGKESVSEDNSLFWLSNIVFCYLLILPIYDQLLLGRFALFMSIPMLIILMFTLTHSINQNWIKKGVFLLVLLGTVTMAFGEFMSLKFHNRNKTEIYTDLMIIKEKQHFHPNDLIITKYGAEHICNWFLNTKSSLITSLNLSDFDKYKNVYILNPIEGALNYTGIENIEAISEVNKFIFMRTNIPKSIDAKMIYESDYTQLLLLKTAPKEWKWDKNGHWINYTK